MSLPTTTPPTVAVLLDRSLAMRGAGAALMDTPGLLRVEVHADPGELIRSSERPDLVLANPRPPYAAPPEQLGALVRWHRILAFCPVLAPSDMAALLAAGYRGAWRGTSPSRCSSTRYGWWRPVGST